MPRRLRKGRGTVTDIDLEDAAAATKERDLIERSREGGWTMKLSSCYVTPLQLTSVNQCCKSLS